MVWAVRIGIGLICALAFAAGREAGHGEFPSSNAATSAEITAQPAAAARTVAGVPLVDAFVPTSPRIDLFGNEVDDALAKYRVNLEGDIYEQRSPDTAVPKRGVPTT